MPIVPQNQSPKDKADDCNASAATFVSTIEPLMKAKCQNCHSNGNGADGVNLEGYENIKKQAAKGILMKVIEHQEGVPRMPKMASKFSDCDINQVKAWIAAGMKE
ncbi:MAG: cytochrome c [Flavobacteriaceae bacterium]|nr:cytochrome c [Flavobacteriaceae bacterium]